LTVRRVFQAVRIAVNEEFVALDTFLRVLPDCLKPGGRAAILTFHSGEDRRVKKVFQSGVRDGVFSEISEGVITAGPEERRANPRSAPAKLRWAIRV
jgi:16S rRNA (cytosine1402-N4)-methyltransferase